MRSRGMSLVQVMIAFGLAGGLALVIAKMSSNMTNVQVRSESSRDGVELENEVKSLLTNPKTCDVNFSGIIFRKLDIDNNGVIVAPDSTYDSLSEGLDFSLWLSNPTGTAKTREKFNSSSKSQFGKVTIELLRLVVNGSAPICPGHVYCNGNIVENAQVVLIYNKRVNRNQTRRVIKTFDVSLSLSSLGGNSTINGCRDASQASEICTALGGSWDNIQGRCSMHGTRKGFCTEKSGQDWNGIGSCPSIPHYTRKTIRGIAAGLSNTFECCYIPDNVSAQGWCSKAHEAWNGNTINECSGTHPLYHIRKYQGVWSATHDQHVCCFIPKDQSKTTPVCGSTVYTNSSFSGCPNTTGYNRFEVHSLRSGVERKQGCCWYPN